MKRSWQEVGIETRGRTRGEFKTLCPECSPSRKHSRDPCLSVDMDNERWNCHNCEFKGYLDTNPDSWKDKIHRAKERRVYATPNPVPPPRTFDKLPFEAAQFFIDRKISEEAVVDMGVTWEDGALKFPYYLGGQLVNVKTRRLPKGFQQEKDAELVMWNLDRVDGADVVIVVEGEMDLLSVYTIGEPNVLSVPNGASGGELPYLKSAEHILTKPDIIVVIAVDSDEAGRTLEAELARRIGKEKCYRVRWPEDCKDANDVLVKHGAEALSMCLSEATPYPVPGIIDSDPLRIDFMDSYDRDDDKGFSTGFQHLDIGYTIVPGQLNVVTGIPSSGKALALDTPIPTPTGWTTMGEIRVGDLVFDESGKTTRVIAATGVMQGRPCYRVTFSDGTEVVCDEQHQWLTRDQKARRSERNAERNDRLSLRDTRPKGIDQTHLRTYPSVKTAKEISDSVLTENGKRANHSVRVAGAIVTPTVDLPVDPYVLGAWLGDGSSYNGGITVADQEILDHIRATGFEVSKRSTVYGYGILGLQVSLDKMDLIQNKHVPMSYMRADPSQRLALLQGLMDTDGCANLNGSCEFCSTNIRLAESVQELVVSLGGKATVTSGRAAIYGRDCGPKYRVHFTPNFVPFRLSRKTDRLSRTQKGIRYQGWRSIVACDPTDSVPVRCIQVDSSSHLYLVTRSFIPTHNSEIVDAIAINTARQHEWRWAMFSPENYPPKWHMQKFAEKIVGKPFRARYHGHERMTRQEAAEAFEWASQYVSILYPEEPTIDALLDLVKIDKYRRGTKCFVIDPWNEVQHDYGNKTETNYIGDMLGKIRRFGRDNEMAPFVVPHPRIIRPEKKGDGVSPYTVPEPYDIAASANWYNKADNILAVARDKKAPGAPVRVYVQKIRWKWVGQVGYAELKYDVPTGRYFSHRWVNPGDEA